MDAELSMSNASFRRRHKTERPGEHTPGVVRSPTVFELAGRVLRTIAANGDDAHPR